MAGRKTENQNGLKYKIERKPQGNIEIPAVFAYDIVAASKKRLQSTKCKSASLRNKGKQGNMTKRVLTMQDISCLGQCSLTVALPIISACGIETVILPSAVLSTHTGGSFKNYTFHDLTDDIPGILKHWKQEGFRFDCLYTGYLGNIRQINLVEEIRKELLTDDAPCIIDPAMADFGKLYTGFDTAYVHKMKELCGQADVLLPNLTEAAFLTGLPYRTRMSEAEVHVLLKGLAALGSKHIILKGVSDTPDQIGVAIYNCETDRVSYYFTRRLPRNGYGTGDCFASAFTGAYMRGMEIKEAASLAADFVLAAMEATTGDEKHWYGVHFEQALPLLMERLVIE